MRKIITLFVILLCIINAKAQYVTIPNTNFRAWLQTYIPSAMSGNQMDTTNLAVTTRTSVNVQNKLISDLTGIQYFKSLKELACAQNLLTSLPRLPDALVGLDCSENQLTSLPVLNDSLRYLKCTSNQLSSLPALPIFLGQLQCGDNQLTTIPPLPSTIGVFFCGANLLANLPSLPNALSYFSCSNNQLTSLPVLPSSIQILSCSYNQISSLPALPNSLLQLQCGHNPLNQILSLPNSLTNLECRNNQLTSLPALPNTITSIICDSNQLTTLPVLPNSLEDITCSFNLLSNLPSLPPNMAFIICDHNLLNNLPTCPTSLFYLDCSYNNILCFNAFDINLSGLNILNNPNTCVPNYLPIMDSATLNYPICFPGNANECIGIDGIYGNTYKDNNNNCNKGTGDLGVKNISLKIYDISHNQLECTNTMSNGAYHFSQTANNYTVSIDTTNLPFTSTCVYPGLDSSLTISILDTNINFALDCKPGFDVGIQSIIKTGQAFPGQNHTLTLNAGDISHWYNLNCAAGLSGTLSFTISGPVTYIGPAFGALTPNVTGNVFTYNIADFGTINNTTDFKLIFQTDTTAQAGNDICIYAFVSPINGDINPINNPRNYCYHVVNSHDPNIKEVYPVDVQPGFNDWLTYTIHFQNTGNAPAYNIRLADTLDNMLDLETFQVINYSHINNTTLNGKMLSVYFPNIMLPDSTSNPSGSIGYIQYRIKPKVTWAAPYKIKNTAYIYFDYNSPIVTNSTYNSIITVTGLNNQQETLATLYPNPTNGTFTVELNTKEKQLLQVFDITGNNVLSQPIENGKATIDANHLAAGIYNISIKGSSAINKKLVIVK